MRQRGSAVPITLIVVVTLLGLGRLCAMDFTWRDDDETIHQNPRMNPPTLATLGYYWAHPHKELYIPLTYTAWAGLAAMARLDTPGPRNVALNPWVFHGANVLVHTANALIVFAILRRIVGRDGPAALGAMLFAVHPVQVEVVAWVSGLKDLLCATCVLGAIYCYLRGTRRLYAAAVGLVVLGTLCKPTAVVAPLLLAVLDRFVVRRDWRAIARDLWPFAAAVVPCVVWSKVIQNAAPQGPPWSRPLVATDALAFYLGKLAWPARLVFDYGHDVPYLLRTGELYWTWVVPAALAVVLYLARRRVPLLIAAGLAFLVGLLPVLGLVPYSYQRYSTVADHYLYLPMFGVALAAAAVLERWRARRVGVVVAAALVGVLATRSALQAGYWQDDVTLNRHRLEVNASNGLAHYNLAVALEFRARDERDEALRDEAVWHLRQAIRLKPDAVLPRSTLATILMRRGQTGEGLRLLQEATAIGDRLPAADRREAAPAHYALGLYLARQGKDADAVVELRAARACQPDSRPIADALAAAEGRRRARPATTAPGP